MVHWMSGVREGDRTTGAVDRGTHGLFAVGYGFSPRCELTTQSRYSEIGLLTASLYSRMYSQGDWTCLRGYA